MRGPWKILDDCPAPKHNTISAARGRLSGHRWGMSVPHCICPRALVLKGEHLRARRNTMRSRGSGLRRNPLRVAPNCAAAIHCSAEATRLGCTCEDMPAQPSSVRGKRRTALSTWTERKVSRAPYLDGAMCGDLKHVATFDKVDDATGVGAAARLKAKGLCARCPVQQTCRDDALRNEEPPGSWGGVYGGLDRWERERTLISA